MFLHPGQAFRFRFACLCFFLPIAVTSFSIPDTLYMSEDRELVNEITCDEVTQRVLTCASRWRFGVFVLLVRFACLCFLFDRLTSLAPAFRTSCTCRRTAILLTKPLATRCYTTSFGLHRLFAFFLALRFACSCVIFPIDVKCFCSPDKLYMSEDGELLYHLRRGTAVFSDGS